MKHDFMGTGQKMIKLLDYCLGASYPITVSEIADLFKCHKRTALRLIKTFDVLDYELVSLESIVYLSENRWSKSSILIRLKNE